MELCFLLFYLILWISLYEVLIFVSESADCSVGNYRSFLYHRDLVHGVHAWTREQLISDFSSAFAETYVQGFHLHS